MFKVCDESIGVIHESGKLGIFACEDGEPNPRRCGVKISCNSAEILGHPNEAAYSMMIDDDPFIVEVIGNSIVFTKITEVPSKPIDSYHGTKIVYFIDEKGEVDYKKVD